MSRLASSWLAARKVVRPVERVPRLEGDDLLPAHGDEAAPQLGGRLTQRHEVIVVRELEALEPAAHVPRVGLLEEIGCGRVLWVDRAVDLLGLSREVGLPDLLDVEDGQGNALEVPQVEQIALGEIPCDLLGHIERDGDGPERAVGEPHGRTHALVVLPAEEPRQRGEAAIEQQLQIADLPGGQRPGHLVPAQFLELLCPVRHGEQVDQGSPVGRDQMRRHRTPPSNRAEAPARADWWAMVPKQGGLLQGRMEAATRTL